jgi:hypothetical protein
LGLLDWLQQSASLRWTWNVAARYEKSGSPLDAMPTEPHRVVVPVISFRNGGSVPVQPVIAALERGVSFGEQPWRRLDAQAARQLRA